MDFQGRSCHEVGFKMDAFCMAHIGKAVQFLLLQRFPWGKKGTHEIDPVYLFNACSCMSYFE